MNTNKDRNITSHITQTENNRQTRLVLRFTETSVGKPIIYHLIKDYDLIVNIHRAEVTGDSKGKMIIDLEGTTDRINDGRNYLKKEGVSVTFIKQNVSRDAALCTDCGACTVHCPTQAITVKDRITMMTDFDNSKCVACQQCIAVCPYNAMKIEF
ncbi:4Fe-4S binding protein [Candidatus Woesearchaeota archaeon]|nr:4Fe-4S binding protein [Candidatus Woesearchaeota archaeon]